jgi:sulfofructosephosphate aldolase
MLTTDDYESALARMARPSGAFAMVAMDQRESLRAMFAENLPEPIELERRVGFKVAVARVLSPHASAMLIDQPEGLEPILAAGALDPGCALIIAADDLVQPMGAAVDDTGLDRSVDLMAARRRGAVAAKLLVIWKPDRSAADRASLVREFLAVSRGAGLAGIVEGVVRPPAGVDEADWTEREDALLEATRELGALHPDIYKAQVPFNGKAPAETITDRCRSMTDMLPCPWVVLSSGVSIEDYPAAVEAACRGGASGFLAGRAVWRDALVADPEPVLRERAVPRLQRLADIVDTVARPWTEAPRPAVTE